MKTSEIAQRLKRSETAVRTRAYLIGLPMRNPLKYMGSTRSKQNVLARRSATLVDIGWCAGFLEGEGSFTNGGTGERVQAKQVSREPLDRLQSVLGGSINPYSMEKRRRRGGQANDGYCWMVCGARARGIMFTLYAMLSSRRQRQIRTAMAY